MNPGVIVDNPAMDDTGFLDGHHALVTGGGTGIGAAISSSLADSGAEVTICSRNPERPAGSPSRRIHPLVMDVTDENSVRSSTARAVEERGPVTIHIANAGIAEGMSFGDSDLDHWRRMLNTNLLGAYLSIRESLDSMQQGKWGRIIAIASVAGLRGLKGASAYTASKHGLVGLVRALSEELKGSGITVNAVCPGYVDTPLVDRNLDDIMARAGKTREEALASMLRLNRDRRLVDVSEVAAVVAWLCGAGSEGINGQVIPIAGGQV